jgi:hypothetical protein
VLSGDACRGPARLTNHAHPVSLVQTRLDAQGQVIGVYEPAAGQNDLFSIFGAANAQVMTALCRVALRRSHVLT